jgi:hypothetical protein
MKPISLMADRGREVEWIALHCDEPCLRIVVSETLDEDDIAWALLDNDWFAGVVPYHIYYGLVYLALVRGRMQSAEFCGNQSSIDALW